MLKWLIVCAVVALVSHWSSKEVHADSPLTAQEEELLVKLRDALDESNDKAKRDDEDSDPCDYCQYADDPEECLEECYDEDDKRDLPCEDICDEVDSDEFEECMNSCEMMGKRMLAVAKAQEENQERALGSDSKVSKKIWGIPRIRIPSIPRIRIPPWRFPRVPRIRIPPIPRIRIPRIRIPWRAPRWGKK